MSEIYQPDEIKQKNTMTLHTTVIQPERGWASLGLGDVWEYRELLYLMVWREIQGIYRQTALGMSWLFLRPIISMVVLSVIFGGFMQVPSDGLPYPLFSLSALLPWTFFSQGVMRASGSLVSNAQIISKVYFPRLVIPIAGALSGLVDFLASFLVFLVLMVYYKMPLRVEMLWLPVFLLVALGSALAVGLWLATLAARFRDVSFAVNYLVQVMMYASPVIYPVSLVPEQLQLIYMLNPMTGVINGFRWALLGSGEEPGFIFLISIGIVLFGLISGAYVFRRTEKTIVDVI